MRVGSRYLFGPVDAYLTVDAESAAAVWSGEKSTYSVTFVHTVPPSLDDTSTLLVEPQHNPEIKSVSVQNSCELFDTAPKNCDFKKYEIAAAGSHNRNTLKISNKARSESYLRIPPAYSVVVLSWLTQDIPTVEVLQHVINDVYPYDSRRKQYTRFEEDARTLLPRATFFEVLRLLEQIPRWHTEAGTSPTDWVARECLGWWGGGRVSSKRELDKLVERVSNADETANTELWHVLAKMLITPGPPLEGDLGAIRTIWSDVFDNEPWHEILPPRAFVILLAVVSRAATIQTSITIARRTDDSVEEKSRYEKRKRQIWDMKPEKRGQPWAELVPQAATVSVHEYFYVLANACHSIGEDARHAKLVDAAHPLFALAAELHDIAGSEKQVIRAQIREAYTRGHIWLAEEMKYSAEAAFRDALDLIDDSADEPHHFDTLVILVVLNAARMTWRRCLSEDIDIATTQERLIEYLRLAVLGRKKAKNERFEEAFRAIMGYWSGSQVLGTVQDDSNGLELSVNGSDQTHLTQQPATMVAELLSATGAHAELRDLNEKLSSKISS